LSRYLGPVAQKLRDCDAKKSVKTKEEIPDATESSFIEDFSSSDYESGAHSSEDVDPPIILRAPKNQRPLVSYAVDAIDDREEFIKARVF